MTDKAPAVSREQQLAEVEATARQIIDLIADKPHGPSLDALMLVYKELAIKFPCCTQNAANQSMAIAMQPAQCAALDRDGHTSASVH